MHIPVVGEVVDVGIEVELIFLLMHSDGELMLKQKGTEAPVCI
jgi:hypothetical protein